MDKSTKNDSYWVDEHLIIISPELDYNVYVRNAGGDLTLKYSGHGDSKKDALYQAIKWIKG